MFAVFEAKGFQYCGSPGDKLKIPHLDTKVGEKVSFESVLLVKNGDIKIGKPYIEGASIEAEVLEQARYKKILVFKFKKRTRYKRTRGHRQTYTEIEIKNIILGGKVKPKVKEEKEKVKAEKKTTAKSETKKIDKKATKKTAKGKAKKTTVKAKETKTAKGKAKKTTKKTTKGKAKKTKKTTAKKKKSETAKKTEKKKTTTKKKTTGKTKKGTKKEKK